VLDLLVSHHLRLRGDCRKHLSGVFRYNRRLTNMIGPYFLVLFCVSDILDNEVILLRHNPWRWCLWNEERINELENLMRRAGLNEKDNRGFSLVWVCVFCARKFEFSFFFDLLFNIAYY